MAKKNISVIERRLQSGSALAVGSVAIPMKDPTWTIRWENSEIAPDHIHRCINVLGWEYVTKDDVDCSLEEVGAREQDTRVVRGERGKEVLLKMKLADYKKVQKLKDRENIKQTFDKKHVKNAMVSQVASQHGDQAADFINQSVNNRGTFINDSRERVSLDD